MSTIKQPHFIYLCGCDGTGKSTQAKALLVHLQNIGLKPHHLWLRFPFFFSLPLLVYAHWRGLSWSEEINGTKYGYWNFDRSRLLQLFLPWTLLLDAALAAISKIYVPLWWGRTLVCERFTLDMLADLIVAFNDPTLTQRLPGRLYPRLLPRQAAMVMLDLDADTIRARRPDLRLDRRLEARLAAFRQVAASQKLIPVSSQLPLTEVEHRIWAMVWQKAETVS